MDKGEVAFGGEPSDLLKSNKLESVYQMEFETFRNADGKTNVFPKYAV